MAKPKGKAAPAPRKRGARAAASEQLPSDDELDAFQKQRDKISLDVSDDAIPEDELDEEAVYDLSDDEDDELESGDEEEDLDDMIARGGRMAERERAAAPGPRMPAA